MKAINIIYILLFVIIFTFTACQYEDGVNGAKSNGHENSASKEYFVHRDNNQIKRDDVVISLKAINFDNLTWFSEAKLEDGTPVFTLHHNETDYDKVKSYGFNAIRYFINWRDFYRDPFKMDHNEDGWKWLDQNIEWAKEHDIFLILDFHCYYGGFGTQYEGTWPIWTNKDIQSFFISSWVEIAKRYKDETMIAGFDLMNEPSLAKDGIRIYSDLLQRTIQAIREVDKKHLLIVEAAAGIEGDEKSWTRPNWVKVEEENIMYSFHFYDPLSFTHNGALLPAEQMRYPDESYNQKDLIRSFHEFVSEPFLKEYPLFLGEFGCNNWTKDSGALLWISDVYQLCKELQIHSALFTYRSFEDYNNKSDYSFAISRIYYNANTDHGIKEVLNEDMIKSVLK